MLIDIIRSIHSGNAESLKLSIAIALLSIPIFFLALSLHEAAHGFVAYKLGDPTAKLHGRLTLNPFKHFDVIGFVMLMLVGFGWAKPVPINARNFKDPRKGMALTALAGPVANLLLGFVLLFIATAFTVVEPASMPIQTGYSPSLGTKPSVLIQAPACLNKKSPYSASVSKSGSHAL